jgi:hypothetical protein
MNKLKTTKEAEYTIKAIAILKDFIGSLITIRSNQIKIQNKSF